MEAADEDEEESGNKENQKRNEVVVQQAFVKEEVIAKKKPIEDNEFSATDITDVDIEDLLEGDEDLAREFREDEMERKSIAGGIAERSVGDDDASTISTVFLYKNFTFFRLASLFFTTLGNPGIAFSVFVFPIFTA